MEKILGYSCYLNKPQDEKYRKAYSIKSDLVERSQMEPSFYGSRLETILVFYIFEPSKGEFDKENFKTSVSRYSRSDKSIRVTFYVGFSEFDNKSVEDQLQYYFTTTMDALHMIKAKFKKQKNSGMKFDFDQMIKNISDGFHRHVAIGSQTNKYKSLI